MNSIKYFLYFALCFFGIIWLFNFHNVNKLQEIYNKVLQEHERLLKQDSINQCIFDSLQYQLDSLEYTKLNKPRQVEMLDSLGLSKKEIRALKYEADRVEKLLELMKDD